MKISLVTDPYQGMVIRLDSEGDDSSLLFGVQPSPLRWLLDQVQRPGCSVAYGQTEGSTGTMGLWLQIIPEERYRLHEYGEAIITTLEGFGVGFLRDAFFTDTVPPSDPLEYHPYSQPELLVPGSA